MKMTLISVLLAGVLCAAFATAMGDLAATMKAGDWRQLTTTNMPAVLAASGSSGGIIGYSSSAAWDSNGRKFYFIGSDHCDIRRFVCYDANTNAWSRLAQPPWVNPSSYCNGMGHGYDHQDINVAAGIYYFRDGYTVHSYKISNGTWSDLPANNDFYSVAFGISYFPEAHGLFVADMQIEKAWILIDNTSQWKTLSAIVGTAGSYHGISEYNPVHKVVIFGGGNGNRSLYKIDSLQKITRLKDSPVDLNCSSLSSLLTVDPVSGDYLVFTSDGLFHVYHVLTDTWTTGTGSGFFGSTKGGSNGAVWGVIAAPVSNYGVVMFAKDNLANSMVYLYKHAVASGTETTERAGLRNPLRIAPNPFFRSTRISFPSRAVLEIYDLSGKRIERMEHFKDETIWTPPHSAGGVFIVKLNDGKAVYSQKLLFLK